MVNQRSIILIRFMRNLQNEEFEFGYVRTPIDRYMRCYTGSSSDGSGSSQQTSQSQGGGVSTSTSQAQLTPQQVLDMYNTALPQLQNTTNQAIANSAAAPSLQAAQNGATSAINAINLNGLSPGEQNAVERQTNQQNQASGNLGAINPTNTISNALNFGNAYQNKIGLMNSAVSSANGVTSAANTTTGTTASLFNPVTANANTSVSKSNSVFGNQASGQGTGNNQSSAVSGGLCFLTTACCEYKGLPDNCDELVTLRDFRDTFVPRNLVEEYYRIAPNIVVKIEGNEEALEHVYLVVQQCVKDIKEDRKEEALKNYRNMVEELTTI